MSQTETVIEGTIQPDGTLVLDEQPMLPPGRVTVVLRQESEIALPQGDSFFDLLKDIWVVRARASLTPRTVEEVESQRQQMRDDSELEILEAQQLQENSRCLSQETMTLNKGQQ